ncbi:hypothetical protein DY218_28595 [Streptomyces triticagri]|uniref:Uncharacterized protein n=1 Tax=Streptomyces triticagri TaxID=2293568 RepID=A0A372LXJ7_9ACTN|nr:hypothetical protein [Streptomyces triticagri]RFU83269.1 hypothetical protein DY218_28595 [Streptomyces triticagri]
MTRRNPERYPAAAAEEIRKFNHATLRPELGAGLAYPGQAYQAVASLKMLVRGLPQTFEQIGHALTALEKSGHLTADVGQVDEHAGETRAALASAAIVATTLADFLDHAHTALSPLGYNTAKADANDRERRAALVAAGRCPNCQWPENDCSCALHPDA